MSNIKYLDIDENYPRPGINNSTAGFRKNFNIIKNSLRDAQTEIKDLQSKGSRLDSSNDFSGNDIINANLIYTTNGVFDGGGISQNLDLDFSKGSYQTFTLLNNLNFIIRKPIQGLKFISIKLELKGNNRTVNFNSPDSSVFYDRVFPLNLIIKSTVNPTIVEVNYQESIGFILRYLGFFDPVRYPSLDLSGVTIPVAGPDNLGLVKIGSGINLSPDGSISAFSGNYSDLIGKITDINQLTDSDNLLTQINDIGQLTDNDGLLFSGNYNDLTDRITDISQLEDSEGLLSAFPDIGELIESGVVTKNNIVEELNKKVSDIPNDTELDSIVENATPTTTMTATKTVILTDINKINYYKIGQKIKIFGASANNQAFTAIGTISATKNGFASPFTGTDTLEYRISLFDLTNGKIGTSSPTITVSGINLTRFNLTNNISLTIQRVSANNGVLIYRKTNSSVFSLIDVLGTKELSNKITITYFDYFDFDRTIWSRKSENNTYISTTKTIHFPVVSPSNPLLGWSDAEIESINLDTGGITFKNNYFFNNPAILVHDDTEKIQNVINEKSSINRNELNLGSKIYYVSKLTIPNNFTLQGISESTIIKKMPWSSIFSSTNNIIEASDKNQTKNITLKDFSIDGNMQNQCLVDDELNDSNNYIVVLKGTNLTYQNLVIDNIVGGGIFSQDSDRIFVQDSKITNSGMSDRFPGSPLVVIGSFNSFISNNLFKNFSESIDASSLNTGMITGNIVDNCGSGILIFGSLKLVTNPNLILGPAGEFIPGPDISNSEYDVINIILEPNTTFFSDVYVYQENGNLFDLTANRPELFYRVDKLRKVDNVEELYGEILINGGTPIVDFVGPNRSQGQFKFAISEANVNLLKTTYSYSTLKNIDNNHIGLVYRVFLKEYSPIATIDDSFLPLINSIGSSWFYQVKLTSVGNLNIGAKVRFLGHGGTPNLDSVIGTISSINSTTRIVIIQYSSTVSSAGSGGQLTRENIFILAKGKIQ